MDSDLDHDDDDGGISPPTNLEMKAAISHLLTPSKSQTLDFEHRMSEIITPPTTYYNSLASSVTSSNDMISFGGSSGPNVGLSARDDRTHLSLPFGSTHSSPELTTVLVRPNQRMGEWEDLNVAVNLSLPLPELQPRPYRVLFFFINYNI